MTVTIVTDHNKYIIVDEPSEVIIDAPDGVTFEASNDGENQIFIYKSNKEE